MVVNQTTSFLDGDQAAADTAARDMATAPSRIFPASTYGNVTTSGISNGTAANPAGRLQARLESAVAKPDGPSLLGTALQGLLLKRLMPERQLSSTPATNRLHVTVSMQPISFRLAVCAS